MKLLDKKYYIFKITYNIYFPIQLINKFLDKHNNSTNTIDDYKIYTHKKNVINSFLVTKHAVVLSVS